MNRSLMIAIATLCRFTGGSFGDELKIKYPDEVLEAFGDQLPLRVEAIRKGGKIELRLVNISKKHVVITKHNHSWQGHYEANDGTKLDGGGAMIPAEPKKFFDHVVLEPHVDRNNGRCFSSWDIWKISGTHEAAQDYVFDLTLSGYFPTIDKYVTFSVTGRLSLKTEPVEQAGARQPSAAVESKTEPKEEPQSGSGRRSK